MNKHLSTGILREVTTTTSAKGFTIIKMVVECPTPKWSKDRGEHEVMQPIQFSCWGRVGETVVEIKQGSSLEIEGHAEGKVAKERLFLEMVADKVTVISGPKEVAGRTSKAAPKAESEEPPF